MDASSDADILVFVIPHQFIGKVCDTMKGKIKSDAVGISLIKVKSLVLVLFCFVLSLSLYPFKAARRQDETKFATPCVCLSVWVSVSLQGVEESADGLKLISDVIVDKLGITMSVLMGANIANEVADEKFCETTIGSSHRDTSTGDQFSVFSALALQV